MILPSKAKHLFGYGLLVILCLFIALVPKCSATSISSAVFFTGVYNPSANLEQIFYITSDSHINEYDVQTGITTDLTATEGAGDAQGPTLSAVYVPSISSTEVFYIAQLGNLVQMVDTNGAYTFHLLNNIGGINGIPNPWASMTAAFDTKTDTLEVSYQLETGSNSGQYGPDGEVVELTYDFSTNSWSGRNLYNDISRNQEQIETQVNNYFNPVYGQMQVGFDPNGENHIHIISYIPHDAADKSEDLMDTTSSVGDNATNGGGGGVTPVCQPGGFASTYNSTLNTMELYYFGTDGYSHQILYNGSWHSLDITKTTNAAQPSNCGPFAAAFNPTVNKTEFFYTVPNANSASGIAIQVLTGQGQNNWQRVTSFFGASLSYGDPQRNGPMTVIYNANTRSLDLFYHGFVSGDASAHLFELSHQADGTYGVTELE